MNDGCGDQSHVDRVMYEVPALAATSILLESDEVDITSTTEIKGKPCITQDVTVCELQKSLSSSGFQATQLAQALEEVIRMRQWRPSDEDVLSKKFTPNARCSIWLSFTSNLISSGLREIFAYLAKEKLVDVIVTSAGGVEEDFIKCLAPTFLGDFHLKGSVLRQKGWNRIGNLIVPNKNYCAFEDWVQPLLTECLRQQVEDGRVWTPSMLIDYLGSQCIDSSSVYHWCHRTGIPVFCPALTDGSLGDNLYFLSYKHDLDVLEDVSSLYQKACSAAKVGLIVLGGGIAMHHSCMAQLPRGGADFGVFINTGQEYDGCFSGSTPSCLTAFKYFSPEATPVKVFSDATICFPIIAARAFGSIKP